MSTAYELKLLNKMRLIKSGMFILFLLLSAGVSAQSIIGKVLNTKQEPLPGATIMWLGTDVTADADENGAFEIITVKVSNPKLIAMYPGYVTDTIHLQTQTYIEFRLRTVKLLKEVVVTGIKDGVVISDLKPIKTEQITQTELKKAACCDLAGCFETQTTVQPQTTNVITNAKELRILGLSGVYNQVLIDGFPIIQGLTYTYGISSMPGTLVDNIYVSKGANSVLQGFESMSGQINVETKEPDKTDRLLINVYANNFMERHMNANYSIKKGKWSNLTALHSVQPANKVDRDNDNFLDLPLLTRYMFYNKWKYGNEKNWGWSARIALRMVHEQRIGGQTNFEAKKDEGSNRVYGQTVSINQPELWMKTGYRLNDIHNFVLFASAYQQQQASYFGTVKYTAGQNNFYTNLQHELNYSAHDLKTGLSYRFLHVDEDIAFTDTLLKRSYNGNYQRVEHITGVFTENTMRFFNNRLTWIAGIRSDYHQVFGLHITPRTLVKYDITPKTIIRANIGSGWRTVNLFSENIGLLVSSRNIIFMEALRPEKSVNIGFNLTQKFETHDNNLTGYFSADYYHTNFQNQIFPDYDSDPTKAIIKNFTGTSISNGFQAECFIRIYRRFELKTGYNWLDVYRMNGENKTLLPFNPRHKVLNTFSYKPLSNKFHIDLNVHWYGEQRLPDTRLNPERYQRPLFSSEFSVLNIQFTYNFKFIEFYGGCENVFDFRQMQPIIGWQNPFSPFFDTSSVWGPTRGREVYAGIRFVIKAE
jgi:outer membrane receptor for ferrienterochelin and colicins